MKLTQRRKEEFVLRLFFFAPLREILFFGDRMSIGAFADRIDGIKSHFHNKDFLLTWQHTADELRAVLAAAEALEDLYKSNVSCRVFNGSIAVSNFRDQ